jgi:hypothetical protein
LARYRFWLAFDAPAKYGQRVLWRDGATITIANFASFAVGELLAAQGWL